MCIIFLYILHIILLYVLCISISIIFQELTIQVCLLTHLYLQQSNLSSLYLFISKHVEQLGMVVHTCNPNTAETEGRES
jgi:hypothetical protein